MKIPSSRSVRTDTGMRGGLFSLCLDYPALIAAPMIVAYAS